jgi:hypothetical protein
VTNTNSAKGNPASKRMTNAQRKTRRERSWRNGEERKAERRKRQDEAAARNRQLRAAGELTPWEQANAHRVGVAGQ